MSATIHGGTPAQSALSGIFFAFLGYAAFSVCDATIKAIGTRLPVFEVSFLLVLISGVLLPLAREKGAAFSAMPRISRPWLLLVRSVSGTFAGIFAIIAFTNVPLAEAYALIFFAPVLAVVLAAPLLAEIVGWPRWLSVGFGLLGVIVVMRPGFREIELGHIAGLCSAVSAAISLLTLRLLGPSERPSTIFVTMVVVNLAIAGPLMLWQGVVVPTWREAGLLLVCGLSVGVAQLSIMAATRRIPANAIAPAQYSQLGWAILFGAAFFAEFPDRVTLLGLALIAVSGILLIQRRAAAS